MEEDYYFDDFTYEGGGYDDIGDSYDDYYDDDYYYDDYYDYYDDDYYDDYDDDDPYYDSYGFDNPYDFYDYDDYYSNGIYDEDDYETDGKGGWNFSIGGVPDTLKDFATGLAGNYAQQSAGYKYWKKRTDYEDALRAKWFDKENEFNSYKAMAARIRAAGLNPALVLGGSAGAGAMAASVGRRSSAGGSAPVLGAPITSPSKLAELNVMDSIANKNNSEAERALSDVQHNSYMNRLADAQTGVQNALAGLNASQKTAQDIQNDITRLSKAALDATYNIATGTDAYGNKFYSQVKGYMVDIMQKVLSVSDSYMQNSALAANYEKLVQSVGDVFDLNRANLAIALSNSEIQRLLADVKRDTIDSEVFRTKFKNYSEGALDIIDRIIDGGKVYVGAKGKSIFTTYSDKNGEISGGKDVIIK